jgi:hypothetical protein
MTDINMVRELTNAELELVVGGTRGGETNNTNLYSECGAGRSGTVICMPNIGSIGETFRNEPQ